MSPPAGSCPESFVSQKRLANYDARWTTVVESTEAQELAEFVRESAEDFVKWANATKQRRARLLKRFIQMHERAPQWSAFQDSEFSFDRLLDRVRDFLSFTVQASQGLLERGSTRKLSYNSLNTIRFDMIGLAARFCEELRGDVGTRRKWMFELEQHCQYLAKIHDLPTETRPKYYFGMHELTHLATTAITFSNCLDNSLQHMFLWTCMLYTAARPGSFLATNPYPECFAKYEHLTLLRMSDPLEFLVEFKIVSWKGYHTVFSWHTTFRLSPIRDDAHLFADPGLLLIAIGLRRKAFAAHTTLDSLLGGREHHVLWKSDLLDQPFFVASSPKGTSLRFGTPMKYNGSRDFLKKVCGLSGIGEHYMSAYCFRRGSATILNRVLGSELTKSILHHDQFTDTIHKHYVLPAAQSDLVAAITTGQVNTLSHLSKYDAPALFRGDVVSPHDIVPLALEEALILSPELRLLYMQRDFLRAYVNAGDGIPPLGSKEMAPLTSHLLQEERNFLEAFSGKGWVETLRDSDAEEAASDSGESAGLALYGKLVQRCKKVLGDMRARHRSWTIEQRQGERHRPLTIDDIEKRLADAQQPPDIAKLLRGLVASETTLEKESIANGGRDVVECSAPDLDSLSDGESATELDGRPAAESRTDNAVATRVDARRHLLEELVSHKDAHAGAQPCPICMQDSSLSPEKRAHVYSNWYRVERHMRSCHEPHLTQPYLDNTGQLAATAGEGGLMHLVPWDASPLHDGHALAMMHTIDILLERCSGMHAR